MNYVVAVKPASTPIESIPATLTIESVSVILATVGSLFMLGTGVVQVISKFNKIGERIRDLQDSINSINTAVNRFEALNSEVLKIDRRLDLHLQATEGKDKLVELLLSQLDKRIDSSNSELEKELKELKAEVKQLENYLQRSTNFKVRERE